MLNILDIMYHEYTDKGRICQVWKDQVGTWVTRHFEANHVGMNIWVKDVVHTGHNESWAEDAAENWVMRVNS